MPLMQVSYDRDARFIHSGEDLPLGTTRSTQDTGDPPRQARGLRALLRRNAVTRVPYQVLVALAGAAVVALGIVLLPLPGPGWLVIFVGLGIWASEFRWAARLLRWVRGRVRAWAHWMGRRSPLTRVLVALALLIVVTACVAGAYILLYGVPDWLPGWVPLVD
jgi:uncharacterized protein (TIGR02611 family)